MEERATTRVPFLHRERRQLEAACRDRDLHGQRLFDLISSRFERRARLLRLTPRGEKLHRRLRPEAIGAQFRLLDCLAPNERELLLDLLVRVIEANRVLARPGAARRKRGSLQSSASTK
jgi:hypothetical protein